MKVSRALGIILIILEVISVGLFLVCGQTVFSIIRSVTPPGGQIPVIEDQQTQTATMTFTFTPRNTGLLAVNLDVGFGLTLTDGSYAVKNTTWIYVPPGVEKDVSLSLRVPLSVLQTYSNTGGTFDIYTSIKTLNDLVRLDYTSKSEGGG